MCIRDSFDIDSTVGREVTVTLPHTDWLLEAHFSDGTTMSVTENHRFWSVTDDDWVELQDLDTDDQLLTPDGATVTQSGGFSRCAKEWAG